VISFGDKQTIKQTNTLNICPSGAASSQLKKYLTHLPYEKFTFFKAFFYFLEFIDNVISTTD